MILVAGATGYLGGEICRQLVARAQAVRAMVRPTSDASRVAMLRELGVELVEADLKDRLSLDAACQGVLAVVSGVTAVASRQPGDTLERVDQQGQLQLVEAARAAGALHFVYISYNLSADCPLTSAKRAVEQRLPASGMIYTILRPSYFMELWLSPMLGFDFPNARARIYGTGDRSISWVSLYDVAQFAVASLENLAARNAVIPLGGPEALSPLQVVRIFEALGGRSFAVEHLPEEALKAQRAAASDSRDQSFWSLALDYAAGDAIDMAGTLQNFPLQLRSVRDYARACYEHTVPA